MTSTALFAPSRIGGERRGSASLLGEACYIPPAGLALISGIAVVATGVAVTIGPVIAAGVIVALVAAVAVVRHPSLGGYVLVSAVPVVSGLKRGVPIPGLRLSELLVGALSLLILAFAHRTETQRWKNYDWLLFAYSVGTAVLPVLDLVIRGQSVAFSAINSMFLPMQFFLLYRAVCVSLPQAGQRRLAVQLLLWSSVSVSVLAILQQLDAPYVRNFIVNITDSAALQSYAYETYARATGPFQHWHPLAGYLIVIILLTAGLLLDRKQDVMSRRDLLIVMAFGTAALMLSVTFTSMIGALVGAVLIGVWSGRVRATLEWVTISGIAAATLFGTYLVQRIQTQYAGRPGHLLPETIATRLNVWQDQYLPGLSGHWATGYGPDLPSVITWGHTESVYFTVLLRGGLPLLFAFCAGLMCLMAAVHRGAKFDAQLRPVAYALLAVLSVSWVMNLLYPYATSSGMPQPMWVLAGIVVASISNRSKSDAYGTEAAHEAVH